MRKVWWLLPLLLIGIPAAFPLYLPILAEREGVTVKTAFWCKQGLCMKGLSRGTITAESAIFAWDRSLTLNGPVVKMGGGGGGSGGRSLPAGVTSLNVRDLRVEGLPVSLPPLSGTVLPERVLKGENVEVEGDTVRANLPSEWGPVQLSVQRNGENLLLDATCAPFTFQSNALSTEPLSIPRIELTGTLTKSAFSGEVSAGEVAVQVEVDRPAALPGRLEDLKLEGSFRLKETKIEAVYGLLASVIPEDRMAGFRGSLSAEGHFRWPGPELEMTPHLEGFAVSGLVSDVYGHGNFEFNAKNADGKPIVVHSGEGSAGWMSLEEMGPYLPAAVLAAEDAGFWKHPGYDLTGMVAAAKENQEAAQIKKGGSTLSQQLAKNLFLDGSRTYSRKLRELLYTVEMEKELGKRRILELYLNVVEWGWNLRGAQAAARTYFFKSPKGLLPEEAAWLAGILREPKTAWKEQYQAQRPSQARIRHILLNMVDLTPAEREAALSRPVHLVPPE